MSTFSCLSAEQAKALLQQDEIQIADIRDDASYRKGHLPGATRIDNANIAEYILQSEFESPLIVCCYHGISSQPAAEYLAQQGFEQVYSLDGGFDGWMKSFPELVEVSE